MEARVNDIRHPRRWSCCAFSVPIVTLSRKRRLAKVDRCCPVVSRRTRGYMPRMAEGQNSGVNITKYSSQRSIISADKDVTPEEINALLVKAGKDVSKLMNSKSSFVRCSCIHFLNGD